MDPCSPGQGTAGAGLAPAVRPQGIIPFPKSSCSPLVKRGSNIHRADLTGLSKGFNQTTCAPSFVNTTEPGRDRLASGEHSLLQIIIQAPCFLSRYQAKASLPAFTLQKSHQEFYQSPRTHLLFPWALAPCNENYAMCLPALFLFCPGCVDRLVFPGSGREGGTRRLDFCPFWAGPPRPPGRSSPPPPAPRRPSFPGWLHKIWSKTLRPQENGDMLPGEARVPISQGKATHHPATTPSQSPGTQVRNNSRPFVASVMSPD